MTIWEIRSRVHTHTLSMSMYSKNHESTTTNVRLLGKEKERVQNATHE